MSKLFIIHSFWNNRGDESALRALIDEVRRRDPNIQITVQLMVKQANMAPYFPYSKDSGIQYIVDNFPSRKNLPAFFFALISGGKWIHSKFCQELLSSDFVVHAPGGPSIGDIYHDQELGILLRLLLIRRCKKPYMFYAPSMGPFCNKKRNFFRRWVLNGAKSVVVRENISAKYLKKLRLKQEVCVTLDSAFQHDVDKTHCESLLLNDKELVDFLEHSGKVIGITITDLQWNPKYAGDLKLKNRIRDTFERTIANLISKEYKILFIPQLFGEHSDYDYMEEFVIDGCYIMNSDYDCYFQQYIISRLYAVIGMRYHSNIFSAKMGTPFISVAYEQKMQGFVGEFHLDDYCVRLSGLTPEAIIEKFDHLESSYDQCKQYLAEKKESFQKNSFRTTEILLKCLSEIKK